MPASISDRKGKTGGKWVSRIWTGSNYHIETIGIADDKADADGMAVLSYSQAQKRVRDLVANPCRQPVRTAPFTVRDAWNNYLAWLQEHRKSARVIRWTAEASILPELGNEGCQGTGPAADPGWSETAIPGSRTGSA
jgi:hypothetical protein